jgi:rfaE bifunctional protein nucleotidyltransferase chain/domain
MPGSAAKIRTPRAAAAWREAQPGIVVFTNGVFDLLHPGHVEVIERAREHGDALIVGLNSDASVRRLGKHPGQPFQPEGARARLLAAFQAVDCVVLFDEPTPLELIRLLKPNVLVKGGDYTRDQIVGGDLVEAWGGRVHIVPLIPDSSTTAIVERLRAPS